jgi:hypothetical protein
LLISPWVRRNAVDSHFYTTINLFRTMEQILGLPPQNQFDLAAEPMFPAFVDKPDPAAYTALPNKIPLDELNPPLKALRGQDLRDAVVSPAASAICDEWIRVDASANSKVFPQPASTSSGSRPKRAETSIRAWISEWLVPDTVPAPAYAASFSRRSQAERGLWA